MSLQQIFTHMIPSMCCLVIVAYWYSQEKESRRAYVYWSAALLCSAFVYFPGLILDPMPARMWGAAISSVGNLFAAAMVAHLYQSGPSTLPYLFRFGFEVILFVMLPVVLLLIHVLRKPPLSELSLKLMVYGSELVVSLFSFLVLFVLADVLERRVYRARPGMLLKYPVSMLIKAYAFCQLASLIQRAFMPGETWARWVIIGVIILLKPLTTELVCSSVATISVGRESSHRAGAS